MARRSIAAWLDVYRVRETGVRSSFDDYAAATKTAEANSKQRAEESKVNNCGTCKHWGEPDKYDSSGFRKCKGIVDGADYRNVLDDTPAHTEDGSGYLSSIKTKPDFGCVLWEPKR